MSPKLFRSNNLYSKSLSKIKRTDYLSLNHEIVELKENQAIVFPSIGNYFRKEIYSIWKDVDQYIKVNKLSVSDFDYYAILHSCQNLTPNVPGRYDAVIIPKQGVNLAANKFFQSRIPGGRFIKYKFCTTVAQFKKLSLVIGKHMEEHGIRHGTGISYFKFDTMPDYRHPDNLFIEWYMPLES